MKHIKIVYILISLALFSNLYSQDHFSFTCTTTSPNASLGGLGMGYAKRMKTPPTNDITKYMKVLAVFVEFANDVSSPSTDWPARSAPVYMNQLFAPNKQL